MNTDLLLSAALTAYDTMNARVRSLMEEVQELSELNRALVEDVRTAEDKAAHLGARLDAYIKHFGLLPVEEAKHQLAGDPED